MPKKYNQSKIVKSITDSISTKLFNSETIEQSAMAISKEVGLYLDADRVALKFYDATLEMFTDVIGEYRKYKEVPSFGKKELELRNIDDFLKDSITENKVLVINDLGEVSFTSDLIDYFKKLGLKSLIIIPLQYKHMLTGVISISNLKKVVYSEEQIQALKLTLQNIIVDIELLKSQTKLEKVKKNDKKILEVIEKAKYKENHDELFAFIIETAIDMFNLDMALHFHREKKITRVTNEAFLKAQEKSFVGKPILCTETDKKMFAKEVSFVSVISNLDDDIVDEHCRKYWRELGIESFLLYSPGALELSRKDLSITGGTIIASYKPKKWLLEELNLFQILMDSAINIFLSMQERIEVKESKSTYIATLTHDLRTPIVAGQKALEYVLSKSPESKLKEFSGMLEELHNVNEDLLSLINNLLSLYQLESIGVRMYFEKSDIAQIIKESISIVQKLTIGQNSNIELEIKEDLPLIEVSRLDIKRVITNILGNAIKYNQPGVKVKISVEKKAQYLKVCIADNGRGISENTQAVIFEKYISETRKTGTGLGLYLARQIIEAHNGKLWLDTKIGNGSTFYFTLPL